MFLLDRADSQELLATSISFFGAGVYEELFFRLMLLAPLLVFAKRFVSREVPVVAVAVLVTSLFFALAHYQPLNPYGELFEWVGFSNRMLAGLFFGVVFVLRGFGIAVGTHIAYDILTQL